MATTIGSLMVLVGLDDRDLSRGLDKASRSVRTFGSQLQSAGMAMSAAISLPLAGAGLAALKAAGEIEQASTAFTTMMKSSSAAAAHLADLRAFALQTPFQFRELVDASRRMQALGFAANEVVPKLRIIGNAVSALGLGADGLNRVILALGQMKAKGTAQAEEMRQLAEAGIPAWDALAKKLGVDVATAMKMVERRAVDSATAINAVLGSMSERFGGGMEAQAKTLMGLWSNVKDALQFTLADVGSALLPAAKDIVQNAIQPMLNKVRELAAEFKQLPEPMQNTAIGAGAVATALPLATVAIGLFLQNAVVVLGSLGKMKDIGGILAGTIGGGLTRAFDKLTDAATAAYPAVRLVGTAITTAGVLAAAYAIGTLAMKIWELREASDGLEEATKGDSDAFEKLLIHLHQNGVSTEELDKKYRKFEITTEEYRKGVYALARAHGELVAKQQAAAAVPAPKKLSPEEIKSAFSALGIKDVATDLKETRAAFDLLRNAGLLTVGQLQAGYAKVQQAIKAVAEAALSTRDAFAKQKLALNAPDSRDFERTYAAVEDLIDAAQNTTRGATFIQQFGYATSRAMFEAYSASERARAALNLLRVDGVQLNRDLHFEEALDGFKQLNIQGSAQLRILRDNAQQAFDAISTQDDSTYSDRLQAQARLNEATLALLRNLVEEQKGSARDATEEQIRQLERWERKNREALGRITGESARKSREATEFWKRFGNQVSTILTDLSRSIVDILFPRSSGATKDVAGITELGLRAGVSGRQLDELVAVIENLAKATGEDFGSLAQDAAELFRVFAVGTSEQIPALQTLFTVARATGTSIKTLASGLVSGADVFRAFGLPLTSAAALLGRLSASGEDAGKIMQALEGAMKKLAEQGFSKPGEALLEIIRRIQNAATESEATALAVRYFGSEAQTMARVIRGGGLELSNLAGKFDTAAGSIEDAAKAMKGLSTESSKFAQLMGEVGRSIVRAFVEEGVHAIMEYLRQHKILQRLAGELIDVFVALGKVIVGAFKGGSEAAGELAAKVSSSISFPTDTGTVPSVPGGGGGGTPGGGSGGGAAGGAAGWVGAIGSVATAVSSIIGNFQMAGMNKSLDLIEHETRYTQIHALHILEKLNDFLPKLADIHWYLWNGLQPMMHALDEKLLGIGQSLAAGAGVFPRMQYAGAPMVAGESVATSVSETSVTNIYIDGLNVAGGDAEALDLLERGARLLRAKGVRGTPGVRG